MRKRIRMGKALLLAVLIVCAALPILSAQAALKRGSTGDDVSAVQRRLKQWGYYSGAVDGIFGYARTARTSGPRPSTRRNSTTWQP